MVKLLTVQTFPARVSHPTQPANVDPLLGVAVNVTVLPLTKFALHVDAQLSPGGELVTVPAPAPAKTTARIGPGPTDRTVVLVCPLAVTVIVVNPSGPTLVAVPLPSMVAIEVLEEDQLPCELGMV